MGKHFRCFILVIAHHELLYEQFKQAWVRNWQANSQYLQSMDIKYMYNGSANGMYVSDKDIYFPFEESIAGLLPKTLGTLKYLHDNHITFDYMFRTNLSSFINWKNFSTYIHGNLPPTGVFQGSYYEYHGQLHASGCGFILSYDLTNLLLRNAASIEKIRVDDVDINTFLIKQGYQATKLERMDIGEHVDISAVCKFRRNGHFHHRLRYGGPREVDSRNMDELVDVVENTCNNVVIEHFNERDVQMHIVMLFLLSVSIVLLFIFISHLHSGS
jgi:hypothetical protein